MCCHLRQLLLLLALLLLLLCTQLQCMHVTRAAAVAIGYCIALPFLLVWARGLLLLLAASSCSSRQISCWHSTTFNRR